MPAVASCPCRICPASPDCRKTTRLSRLRTVALHTHRVQLRALPRLWIARDPSRCSRPTPLRSAVVGSRQHKRRMSLTVMSRIESGGAFGTSHTSQASRRNGSCGAWARTDSGSSGNSFSACCIDCSTVSNGIHSRHHMLRVRPQWRAPLSGCPQTSAQRDAMGCAFPFASSSTVDGNSFGRWVARGGQTSSAAFRRRRQPSCLLHPQR